MSRILLGGIAAAIAIIAVVGLYFTGIMLGWHGQTRGPGEITGEAIPSAVVAQRRDTQRDAIAGAGADPETEVLFGDLHVHSTFSTDAFVWALPIMRGEGANPLADACDFARYCSALDFWSITDHAEALIPEQHES